MELNLWSKDRFFVQLDKDFFKEEQEGDPNDIRSCFQQDYDRILFSTPVRRLADKTQVWPMEEHDGIRNRLTHSHEVADLARSIVARVKEKCFPDISLIDILQPIVQGVGLAHDIGNPPFGHQGEVVIRQWFDKNIFSQEGKDRFLNFVSPEELESIAMYRNDFLGFDGNAQTIRILTHLQTHIANKGLDLTAGTLSVALKYPFNNNQKIGYFMSEKNQVDWMRSKTGLREGDRHPLTYIVEAADDIAYSVLDIDDAFKKRVVAPEDILCQLRNVDVALFNIIKNKFKEIDECKRNKDIINDIKSQYFRAFTITRLIGDASEYFVSYYNDIQCFKFEGGLLDNNILYNFLKEMAYQYCYKHSTVLEKEMVGAKAIECLMTNFSYGIFNRKKREKFSSVRNDSLSAYMYSLISPNYIEQIDFFEDKLPLLYRELRLLTDMIAGMTDTYTIKLYNKISKL